MARMRTLAEAAAAVDRIAQQIGVSTPKLLLRAGHIVVRPALMCATLDTGRTDRGHLLRSWRTEEIEGGSMTLSRLPYAAVHGRADDTVITPREKKFLTIPVSPKAKRRRAADFKDLFVLPAMFGRKHAALARVMGRGRKKRLEILFLLVKRSKVHGSNIIGIARETVLRELPPWLENELGAKIAGAAGGS